jgi:hypothetical protein
MDHLHDSNLLVLADTNLPEFVKIANETPLFYAYSDGRESFYPIDTASNTWLSAAYFEKNAASHLDKDEYVTVHDRILEALKLHDVSYESPFTVEKVAEEGYTFIKLASEIKIFEQNYKHIKPEERHEKAKELLHRYQSLKDAGHKENVSLPKIVEEYAGDHLKEDWSDIIKHRASKVDDKEGKEAYHALAKTDESKEIILKLLGMLDKKFGLDSHYDRGITDPFRSLLTMKEPEQKKVIVMVVNGRPYDIDKVASIKDFDFSNLFGGEILDGLSTDPCVYLKTAPEFVKVAVAQAIDDHRNK